MTEEEAKTKWCPFARVASPLSVRDAVGKETWVGVTGANRAAHHPRVDVQGIDDPGNPPSARCIGSACMAWRWKDAPVVGRRLNPDKPAPFDRAGDGFCGLAGKP